MYTLEMPVLYHILILDCTYDGVKGWSKRHNRRIRIKKTETGRNKLKVTMRVVKQGHLQNNRGYGGGIFESHDAELDI